MYVKDAFLSSTYFPNSLEMAASMKCLEILEREKVQDAIWERGTRFLERLGKIVDDSGVPVTKSGIPPMPFLTFDHVDEHYKERRTEFYTQCIRRGLFVQPYHHWYICYRHTEADLQRALDVVEESLAFVAQQYPLQGHERHCGRRDADGQAHHHGGRRGRRDHQGGAAGPAGDGRRDRRRRGALPRGRRQHVPPARTRRGRQPYAGPRGVRGRPSRRSASAPTSSSRPAPAAPWA